VAQLRIDQSCKHEALDVKDVAIEVRNVTKRFRLYHNPITGPIKELLWFWKKHDFYRDFVAVRNVSLQVKKGEVVGIVGPNGAGKSTLLKMMAGLLPIDEGEIVVNGRVTAILALGIGILPELTGRENILYSGLLVGMTREEVHNKTPSIIEFAEIGEYIDQPFRTYSSGMKARLMFAVAMAVEPDILIIDEALAAGDARFVQKCLTRIREICRSGASVLFVSHYPLHVEQLCGRAVLLVNGEVKASGDPWTVTRAYHHHLFDLEVNSLEAREKEEAPSVLKPSGGSREITIRKLYLLDRDRKPQTGFHTSDAMTVRIEYTSTFSEPASTFVFVGFLRMPDGYYAGEWNSFNHMQEGKDSVSQTPVMIKPEGTLEITLKPLLLLNNEYSLWIVITDAPQRVKVYCEYKNVSPFFVARPEETIMRDALFWQPGVIENSGVSAK
jgi:ABC-type polysaccharide/polyol phosphate transport system ATPase subunit